MSLGDDFTHDIIVYYISFVFYETLGKFFLSQSRYKIMYNMAKSSLGHITNHLDLFMRPSASPRVHKPVSELVICPSATILPML